MDHFSLDITALLAADTKEGSLGYHPEASVEKRRSFFLGDRDGLNVDPELVGQDGIDALEAMEAAHLDIHEGVDTERAQGKLEHAQTLAMLAGGDLIRMANALDALSEQVRSAGNLLIELSYSDDRQPR